MKPKTTYCKRCLSPFHTSFQCPKNRKPMKTTTTLKTTKPMNKIGKVQKQTAAAVAKWKKTVTPSHQGFYECYICHKSIPYLMAEHVKSKVRRPDLRLDSNNFKPVCAACNQEKGSKSL